MNYKIYSEFNYASLSTRDEKIQTGMLLSGQRTNRQSHKLSHKRSSQTMGQELRQTFYD